MNIQEQRYALRFEVNFEPVTGLLLRSGRPGEFTDSAVEKTSDNRLHINGYVWASLLRRALSRCELWQQTAKGWGKYDGKDGVAPLWTEATFVEEKDYITVVNPGNRIDRQYGSVAEGALYSDELALPQTTLMLRGIIFAPTMDEAEKAEDALLDACRVIGHGIETIGGGWSYGFGRLAPQGVRCLLLDLTEESGRKQLWQANVEMPSLTRELEHRNPKISRDKGWANLTVDCRIAEGQLLAIHSDVPELSDDFASLLADTFVFTRPELSQDGSLRSTPAITGKAFRQAALSTAIERRLRSRQGEGACLNTSDGTRVAALPGQEKDKRRCRCKRCLWFGDIDAGGIISVGDALVKDAVREVLHRIQVCEHSGQTMQKKLFNGEYLTQGNFTLTILIDHARREETQSDELERAVATLLEEMQRNGKAPPGWHRLGATSTCTGQLEVASEDIQPQHFPPKEACA